MIWIWSGSIAMIMILLLIFRMIYETHTFRIQHYEVWSDKFPEAMGDYRIIFLSDLHNQEYGKENEKLIRAIREERPHLILSGGDMLIRSENADFTPAVHFLKALTGICPVYCANGNHEQQMKEDTKRYGNIYARYRNALLRSGVHMLENDSVSFFPQTDRKEGNMPVELELTGLEIPLCYYKKGVPWKPKRPFTGIETGKLIQEQMRKAEKAEKTGKFRILLAHQPLYAEEYAKWNMDLILCGHFHGGIVRLPVLGGILSPQMTLFPKYSGGKYWKGNGNIIVSKGLGMHSIKLRLFNRAEVVVIHIRPGVGKQSGTHCEMKKNHV